MALPLDYRQRLQQILGGETDPLRDAVLGRLRTQESADPQAASTLDPNRLVQPPLNGAWVNGQWVPLEDEPAATPEPAAPEPRSDTIQTLLQQSQPSVDLGAALGKAATLGRRFLSGPTTEEMGLPAETPVLGPAGPAPIPGVRQGFDYVANLIDPPQGEGGYMRGLGAGMVQGLGNLIAGEADPMAAAGLPGGPKRATAIERTATERLKDVLKRQAVARQTQNLFKGLNKAEVAAKIAEKFPNATARLSERYPKLANRIAKYGADLAVEGATRSPAKALDNMADRIYQRTLTEEGTTTYPLRAETEVAGMSKGVLSGIHSNQSGKTWAIPIQQFTPDTVRQFLEARADEFAKNPNLAVGTWKQTDNTGQVTVYLDVSQKFPTERKAITQAARQAQPATTTRDPVTGQWPQPQKAVFNLKTFEETPVGNLAEFLDSPEFQQRLDDMYQAGVPVMNGKEWWDLYGGPLERVYGKERVKPLAGFLASTSPASAPVHNLRAASEYLRRLIKDEPVIQKGFRIPETAVGSREGFMGASAAGGDFNAPGTQMPMEQTRAPNLRRVERGEYDQLQKDKVNDMFHALTGVDVGVYDRRYAKLAEDYKRGIYVDATKDKVPGSMGTGTVSPYALIENAVRTGAKRHGMPLGRFSAYVWEGIGDTIKKTGQLYGMKHPAHTIPDASQGFGGIFDAMIAEKAKAWGVTVAEFEKRLRNGDAELLMALLATPVGLAAYRQWEQANPQKSSMGPSPSVEQ